MVDFVNAFQFAAKVLLFFDICKKKVKNRSVCYSSGSRLLRGRMKDGGVEMGGEAMPIPYRGGTERGRAHIGGAERGMRGCGMRDGDEGDFFGKACLFGSCLSGLAFGCLKLTIDGYVSILIETGIGFHAWFGLFAAFEDGKVMMPEPKAPFECFPCMCMLEVMGHALCAFDEFPVGHAGLGPMSGEMVGIELEKFFVLRGPADDDVFAVMTRFFGGIHDTTICINAFYERKIAHSAGSRGGIGRKKDVLGNNLIQTGNNLSFQMFCHVV